MTQTHAAPPDRAPHFVQTAGRPIFVGEGSGVLNCRCGQSELVRGYDPKNFLAVDLQCAACGSVTTTPGLSALNSPPPLVVALDRTADTTPEGATLPAGHVLAGREELGRLMAIYKPRGPLSNTIDITGDWLDQLAAEYDRLTGGLLEQHAREVEAAEAVARLSGSQKHKLAFALRALRAGIADPDWFPTLDDEAAVSTAVAASFHYFTESWGHHPLFPQMAAAAADTGFSLHGAAPFAAAKALSDSGNRVAFLPPRDGSGRVKDFVLAMNANDHLSCVVEPFGRYEWPSPRVPSTAELNGEVRETLLASKARINMRRPGMIVLSPGAVMDAIESPLVDAIVATIQAIGRRYRHVSAVSVIVGKIAQGPERTTVGFGYSFLPIMNPHHRSVSVQIGDPVGITW